MAIGPFTVWRIRIAGDDSNGAGFDATISGAGTDYTQQDAAQLSLTDISCANNTTVFSVTGGFTAAMIGNAIHITGGGATAGYYFITARTDTNTVTVDRSLGGVVTGVTGKVGGAAISYRRVLDSTNSTGDKVVPGNVVYIQGSGSDRPSVSDYADTTGYITPVAGDTVDGPVSLIGENGRPRFRSDGLMLYQVAYGFLESLYLSTTSNSTGTFGIVYGTSSFVVKDCIFDLNGQASMLGITIPAASAVISCEIFSTSGTPSSSSGSSGIFSNSAYNSRVINCHIHHCRLDGIQIASYGATVENCIIHDNADNGIKLSSITVPITKISGCTIDNNLGHGITSDGSQSIELAMIYNNNITTNGGYAIDIAAGSTAQNDQFKCFVDFNNFGSGPTVNTSGPYHNISAGDNDTYIDPQYVDAANGDLTPTNTALYGTAYPMILP